MDQDVPKPCYWGNFSGKFGREHSQFTHADYRLIIVVRLLGSFHGDDTVTDIDAALSSHFKVPFGNVPQVGIPVKFRARFIFECFQSRAALFQFV